MTERRGPLHWRAGPRLPTAPVSSNKLDDIGDPAGGAKVDRCLTCGTPLELIIGTFIPDREQRFAGRRFRYRLCIRCIEHANGPQDPDPRYVEAA